MPLNEPYVVFQSSISDIGDTTHSTQIEANLKTFLDWAFLEIGAFVNVTIPTSGAYGGNVHQLQCQNDPNYASGQVYQGFRQDWVWETGLIYSSVQPINVSGVIVNNTFYPTGTTGTYAFAVDYPRGRIVFNNPLPANSTVLAQYSYRNVQVTNADASWYRQLQFDSLRVDSPQFSQFGSGDWNNLQDTRLQLPAVVIELIPEGTRIAYELGSYGEWVYQKCLFHIFAEENWWNKQLRDILYKENEHTIYSFDLNLVASGNVFPLNAQGDRNPSGLMYPALVNPTGQYFWKAFRFCDTKVADLGQIQTNFFGSVVRTSIEVILP